jgi:hypothetical protein
MVVKTCPDCGAPIGDDMLPTVHGCWYWGQSEDWLRRNGRSEADIHSFLHCGADPPCEGNAYNVRQSARDRWDAFWMISIPLGIIGVVLGIAVMAHR